MIAFTVWITDKCNMRCSYCYEENKVKRNMQTSQSVLEKIINFIVIKVNELPKQENVVIDIHGGEPLLEFEKMVYFIECIRMKLVDYNVSYNIVTNGTLLNAEKAKWLNENMDSISISIDGTEEVHDKNRRYVNGKGTYQDIISNLLLCSIDQNKIRLRMTINSKTVDVLGDSISHMIELGFLQIVPSIVYEDDGWTDEKLKCLENELLKIKSKYNKNDSIKIAMTNRKEVRMKGICNGGINRFDILPNGDIYPCSYVVGLELYKIGNVIDNIKIKKDELYNLYSTENQECAGCTYIKYCLGTRCKYLNKLCTGDFHLPSNLICSVENIKYRVCNAMANE